MTPGAVLRRNVRQLRAEEAKRRSALFSADFTLVGQLLHCMRGGRTAADHPHRCRCQDASGETDPHKHYPDPPHSCARGCGCRAYEPAVNDDAAAQAR